MIESIKITNFQVHKDLEVSFDRDVTCIIGPSDVGKSSIIRALRWVLFNEPRGASFIKNGEELCTVEVIVDGHTIIRKKGEGVNHYSLDGKEFRAFREEVPEEIKTLINASDINFQQQLDAPFWFSETAGKVGKELNKIVNLEVMDDILKTIQKKHSEASHELKFTKERLEEAKIVRNAKRWSLLANKQLTRIEQLEQRYSHCSRQISVLALLIQEIAQSTANVQNAGKTILGAVKALALGEKHLQAKTKRNILRLLLSDIQKSEENIHRALPDLTAIEKLYTESSSLNKKIQELRVFLQEVKASWQRKKKNDLLATQMEEELNRLSGGKCPVCGRPNKS